MTGALRRSLAALLVAVASAPAAAAGAQFQCVEPNPAAALAASIGVNTHLQQGDQYANARRTVEMLKTLGITQVREPFAGVGHPGIEYAARKGIKFVFLIGGGWGKKVVPALEDWERRYPGSILAIEGPNEVNNWPVTFEGETGVKAAQRFQAMLYEGVKKSPALSRIPVVALTSWPVFASRSDIGNIHAYERAGGFMAEEIRDAIADERRLNPPRKQIWMTEAGYHTLVGADSDEGVSEEVQAKYTLTFFLDAYRLGVRKTFLYQLLDQYANPADIQSHFGLVDRQWRPKAGFAALQSMIGILSGQDATAAPIRPLRYRLTGLPPQARQMLFQAADGDRLLVVWNEPEIWDSKRDVEIANATARVRLDLDPAQAEIALFDPLTGNQPIARVRGSGTLEFTLDDHPVFVRIESDDAARLPCQGVTEAPAE
ncbi:MAG: hypothetical protein ABWZ57_01255 [Mesorhizobium sp.]